MDGPVHDPNTCAQKGGRWECLHAIDADHFWLGDLMVDLNQIRHEIATRDWDVRRNHTMSSAFHHLKHTAEGLLHPEHYTVGVNVVRSALLAINQLGLHTGYRESPTERER